MKLTNILLLCCCLLCGELTARSVNDSVRPADGKQDKVKRIIHVIGFDFKPSYVFPTHEFLKGANMAGKRITHSFSGHLKYGFRFSPDTEMGQRYPYAIQGIGIGYHTFFNPAEIGNPLSVYAFQSSRITSLSSALSLDYEWNFGASFGWKKYDGTHNAMNRVVGSKINAYINLGFFLNWRLATHTHLKLGVEATHFSNGNTNYPNSGVNTLGASVGVIQSFGNRKVAEGASSAVYRPAFVRHFTYDLVVYGATRKRGIFPSDHSPMLAPGSFGVLGLNFNPLYNVNKYFRAGLSLDMQYDESANIGLHIANEEIPSASQELTFYRPPFREQFAVGLSVRAELVMPVFSINLGIGKNFICKGVETNSFYQIFALKTSITKHIFLHTGYQLYRFKYPNNLMLGIGYRFNAR